MLKLRAQTITLLGCLAFGFVFSAVAENGSETMSKEPDPWDAQDWMTPPDGFAWPGPSSIEVSDAAIVKRAELSAAQQATLDRYVITDDPSGNPPAEIRVIRTDLNQDGRDEWLIDCPIYGGSGGPFYMIVTPTKDGGFEEIGSLQGGFELRKSHGGWAQIEVASRGGGGTMSRVLLRHEKGRYRAVRNEDHDFFLKTVTLRPLNRDRPD
ncbi:MAG: hypothetical protein AAGK14_14620 [Verrucomicrobiota bacterium]